MSGYLSLKETANVLEISTATVTNWERSGLLISEHYNKKMVFDKASVLRMKEKLENGEAGRLSTRANKKRSVRTFIPEEYLENKDVLPMLQQIIEFITTHGLDLQKSLFVICLKKLVSEKILAARPLDELLKFYGKKSTNQNIIEELNKWQNNMGFEVATKKYRRLFEMELPVLTDLPGIIYQSLLTEGHKSKEGAYYTPQKIADEIVVSHLKLIKGDSKILDPCCGTGQFLLSAGEKMKKSARVVKPRMIWGYDVDPMAVQLARINLMILFREYDFNPNIYQRNVLYNFSYDDKSGKFRNFDLIIGNPPWGAEFKIEQSTLLKEKYPEILSFESYSYFILIALNMLKSGGSLSFILPESILNIRTHRDIRQYILKHTRINRIFSYGRIFRNVFTPVIRLDLVKEVKHGHSLKVRSESKSYPIQQNRFLQNSEFIFDIYKTPEDEELISKVYSLPYVTLSSKADWALGIVTGNNSGFISKGKKPGFQEIIKGTDIRHFTINPVSQYIRYEPDKFQQMAPISRYKAPEKLVYKFISSRLIFAYDNKRRLTLNSANILIPKVENYPILSIMALFNSKLYQFLFTKMFFTHKVLRSHLEQLPLPAFESKDLLKLKKLSERIMLASADYSYYSGRIDELNEFVYRLFNLNEKDIALVEQNV